MNPYVLALYISLAVMVIGMLFFLVALYQLARTRFPNLNAPVNHKTKMLAAVGAALFVPAGVVGIVAIFTRPY